MTIAFATWLGTNFVSSAPQDDWVNVAKASVQSCNTDCQSRMTDCSLACDQSASCIQSCSGEARVCSLGCRAMGDAEDAGPGDRVRDAGIARDGGTQKSRGDGGDAAAKRP